MKKSRQVPHDFKPATTLKMKIIKEKILVEEYSSIKEIEDLKILELNMIF